MNILLLTNCIAYEQLFVEQIHSLGHEVLCSKKLVSELQTKSSGKSFSDYFDILIFSETIPDKEVSNIIPLNVHHFPMILRKTEKELNEESKDRWRRYGVIDFTSQETTLDALREKLIPKNKRNELLEASFVECRKSSLDNLYSSLSAQEKEVFSILEKETGKFVSREELSYLLWNAAPTNSMESRLSGIVKNLRKKIGDAGFSESSLVTSWGRGYRLKELVLQEYNIATPEVMTKINESVESTPLYKEIEL